MADHARGERLRQLRSERGLSQEDVAHALGVTAKTYGSWERGGGIRATNARQIATYFGVQPGDLVIPELTPTDDGEQSQLDRIERKLDELLRRTGTGEPESPERRETGPDADDFPRDLPGAPDSEPAPPDQGEDESAAAG